MIKEKLNSMSQEKKEKETKAIHENLFQFPQWKTAKTIGITISVRNEIDTYTIIRKAWEDGKKVAVPKCIRKTKELQFYQLTNFSQLEDSFYGLKEPNPIATEIIAAKEIDFLLVPGLLYDRRGYRVGYGGGYYDRFLAKHNPFTTVLAYSVQIYDGMLPNESFDMPVDSIITAEEVIIV